jgi:hypothetical protein
MNAEAKTTAKVEFTIHLTLTEEEAAALDAIIGYGIQPFLDVFYKHMGEAYLKPFDKGCRSLFSHRQQLTFALSNIKKGKSAISELNKVMPVNQ